MPSYVATDPWTQAWNQTDQSTNNYFQRLIDKKLHEFSRAKSRLFPKLKRAGSVNVLSPEFMIGYRYPRYVTAQCTGGNTITLSGYFNGEAMSAALAKQVVRTGTILSARVSGVTKLVRITATSFADLAYEAVAFGNTNWANDDAPITYRLLYEPVADTRDFAHPRSMRTKLYRTSIQIYQEDFGVTDTDEKVAREVIGTNYVKRNLDLILEKIADQRVNAAIHGVPPYNSGFLDARDTDTPSLYGLYHWMELAQTELANTDIKLNAGGEGLTLEMISSVVWALIRKEGCEDLIGGNGGGYEIWCGEGCRPYIDELCEEFRQSTMKEDTAGYGNNKVRVGSGATLPIEADSVLWDDSLIILKPGDWEHGPWAGNEVHRVEIPTNGALYKQWQIVGKDWGLKPWNHRWIGQIYNIGRHTTVPALQPSLR